MKINRHWIRNIILKNVEHFLNQRKIEEIPFVVIKTNILTFCKSCVLWAINLEPCGTVLIGTSLGSTILDFVSPNHLPWSA